jgi:hypothetical protein
MSHRRLDEVIPSSAPIALTLNSIYFKEEDSASLKMIVEQSNAILDVFIERLIEFHMKQSSPKDVFDIQYDDLMRDPIARKSVHSIFE